MNIHFPNLLLLLKIWSYITAFRGYILAINFFTNCAHLIIGTTAWCLFFPDNNSHCVVITQKVANYVELQIFPSFLMDFMNYWLTQFTVRAYVRSPGRDIDCFPFFFISRRPIGPGREIIKCSMSVRVCVRPFVTFYKRLHKSFV